MLSGRRESLGTAKGRRRRRWRWRRSRRYGRGGRRRRRGAPPVVVVGRRVRGGARARPFPRDRCTPARPLPTLVLYARDADTCYRARPPPFAVLGGRAGGGVVSGIRGGYRSRAPRNPRRPRTTRARCHRHGRPRGMGSFPSRHPVQPTVYYYCTYSHFARATLRIIRPLEVRSPCTRCTVEIRKRFGL